MRRGTASLTLADFAATSALTVREVGLALSDFDTITVWIAHVAERLAVLVPRLRDELGSSTFPQFITRLNIRDADIHKAAHFIRVGNAERHRRLLGRRSAPNVDNKPSIRDLNVAGCAVTIAPTQNAPTKDRFIEVSRSADLGDGEKISNREPVPRGHLKVLLFDFNAVH